MEEEDMITIVCALRSGGDYSHVYVDKLHSALRQASDQPFRFICITDTPKSPVEYEILLRPELFPGWWSKLAAFRIPGPVVYFDLDTMIIGSIEPLLVSVELAEVMKEEKIWMLEGFRWRRGVKDKGRWASGIMAWSGDWSWIADSFRHDPQEAMRSEWDQIYLQELLLNAEAEPLAIQDEIGVLSYKWHYVNDLERKGSELDPAVVCFHGKPRPHEIGWIL